jgi:menaquinone-9 beta-reductase
MPDQQLATACDVTVMGGGLAGKAASLHLAKAGAKVICIEPAESPGQPVGESLDWSSPELLKGLGFPMDEVIGAQIGTWKKHVILKLPEGVPEDYVPVPWLGQAPFRIELRTLHVDRSRLDEELLKKVVESGVTIVRDKVVRIEKQGNQISSVHTESGEQFSSPWYIDASGLAASLVARAFELPAIHNGPPKVAMWTYFPVSDPIEGTTLYMEPRPSEYLDWIWEIPINPGVVSVGYITTGAALKAKRQQGISVSDIFRSQLERFPRFEPLLKENSATSLNVTSFRPRVFRGVAGPNWLIAGEAASMVDPITANGVTAALRHASEATLLILRHFKRGRLPLLSRFCYSTRVRYVTRFFNSGIENIVFQPPVRNRMGIRHSGTIYISPAWTMNLLYARIQPDGILSTLFLGSLLWIIRASEWVLYRLCKLFSQTAEC